MRWSHKEQGIHKQRPRQIPDRDELDQQIEVDGELQWIDDPTDEQLIAEGWYYDSVPTISKYQRLTGVTWDDEAHTCGRSVEYLPIAEVAETKRGEIKSEKDHRIEEYAGPSDLRELMQTKAIKINNGRARGKPLTPEEEATEIMLEAVGNMIDAIWTDYEALSDAIDDAEIAGDVEALIGVSWR